MSGLVEQLCSAARGTIVRGLLGKCQKILFGFSCTSGMYPPFGTLIHRLIANKAGWLNFFEPRYVKLTVFVPPRNIVHIPIISKAGKL